MLPGPDLSVSGLFVLILQVKLAPSEYRVAFSRQDSHNNLQGACEESDHYPRPGGRAMEVIGQLTWLGSDEKDTVISATQHERRQRIKKKRETVKKKFTNTKKIQAIIQSL